MKNNHWQNRRSAAQVKSQRFALGNLFSDATLIAGLTAVAYSVAFVYELGYCLYFSIPIYLITPNTSVVLVALFSLFFTASSLYPALGILNLFLKKLPLAGLKLKIYFAVTIWLFFWLGGVKSWLAYLLVGLITFHALFIYLFALVGLYGSGTLMQRLKYAERSENKDNAGWDFMERLLGDKLAYFAALATLSLGISFGLGSITAKLQRSFQTLAERPSVVIAKNYGEFLIGIETAPNPLRVTGKVLLIKSEGKEIALQTTQLGEILQAEKK